jgi:uncharacterized membrane protein
MRPYNLGQREAHPQTADREDAMKYGDLTLGQVEAIVNKLGGMNGVKQFLSGALVVAKAAEKALEREKKEQFRKALVEELTSSNPKTGRELDQAVGRAALKVFHHPMDCLTMSFAEEPEDDLELPVNGTTETGLGHLGLPGISFRIPERWQVVIE